MKTTPMDNSAGFCYLRPGVWLFYFLPVNLARVLVLFPFLNSLTLSISLFLISVQLNPAFSFQNSKVSLASHSLAVFRKQLVQSDLGECHS